MQSRFTLRIESGDRQGEEIPLPEGTLVVGRRPESDLALKDASVSGRHAELRVHGGEVEVVDLGSKNGTRVDGHKIENANLSHGESVLFGNVRLVLRDAQFGAGPKEPSAPELEGDVPRAPLPADTGALQRISADKVSRSGARSRRLPVILGLGVVLAAGGAAALRFLRQGGEAGAKVQVPDVPGNRVTDGSFEEGTSEWSAAEAAPQAFLRDRSHARSGLLGLGVGLDENGWSLARSEEFELRARRRLELAGEIRAEDALTGRLGLELSSATGALPAVIAWAPALRASDGFRPVQLAFDTLGDYDRGRVVVAALGRGTLSLDDVSVVETEPRAETASFNEYELTVLGDGGSTAALVRSGRVLLAGIDLSAWGRTELAGWPDARLTAKASERGFQLAFPGAPADAVLQFHAVRPEGSGTDARTGWVATTGSEGYASHIENFERAQVTSLLLGSGLELLRLGFARPVTVSGAILDSTLSFRIELGGLEECDFQLTFREERAEASLLAGRAEERERAGDLGAALQAWTALLDGFPFERALVARAEEARSRLIAGGLNEVDAVRRGLERARFFALPELFVQGRDRARELARQYAGSEVEAEARAAADLAQGELEGLLAGGRSGEEGLLQGVLQALDPVHSPRLVEHVKKALAGVDPGSGEN